MTYNMYQVQMANAWAQVKLCCMAAVPAGACLHVMAHETGCMPAAAFCVNTGTGTVSADGGSAMTASSPGQLMLSAYCIPPRRE